MKVDKLGNLYKINPNEVKFYKKIPLKFETEIINEAKLLAIKLKLVDQVEKFNKK